jgi:Fic family protein
MNLNISLPEFREIDARLSSVRKLAQSDPLIMPVRERFHVKITHHLTSLRAGKEKYSGNRMEKLPYDDLKQVYLGIGKERAVIQLLLDMTDQPLSTRNILLLSEILIGTAGYREENKYMVDVNGDRQITNSLRKDPRRNGTTGRLVQYLGKVGEGAFCSRAAWLHYRLTVIHPFSDWNDVLPG